GPAAARPIGHLFPAALLERGARGGRLHRRYPGRRRRRGVRALARRWGRPVNVLIVNHRLDADGGGTARKAVTLAKALRDAGCGVELAAFDFGPPVEPGAEVHTYHVPFTSRRWPFPSGDTRGVTRQVTWADVV